MFLIFRYVNGYFEEINENKYLMLVSTNERNEKIKTYEELWIKIILIIRSITNYLNDHDEKYVKIKFNSGSKLLLNKTIEIPTIKIVVRAVFLENKYYPKVFLDECLYKI